jgi:exosortase
MFDTSTGNNFWSSFIVMIGLLVHFLGTFFFFNWFEGVGLIIVILGLVLQALGIRNFWSVIGPIGFMITMIPLPFRVQTALGGSLQSIATQATTYFLQTIGLPAIPSGNLINLDQLTIGVVEACNGLGMMVTFIALCGGYVLISDRPIFDRALIFLSAIPISLVANVIRISLTAMASFWVSSEFGRAVFHDAGGWIMMPIGLALIGIEMWIWDHVFRTVEVKRSSPIAIDTQRARELDPPTRKKSIQSSESPTNGNSNSQQDPH